MQEIIKREKFNEVYSTYYGVLFNYLSQLTRNKELADDLAQETFIRYYEKGLTREKEEHASTVKSWLYRVAYRIFIDHWRKERRMNNIPLDDMNDSHCTSTQSIEDLILESELFKQISSELQSLNPRTQLIFWMKVVQETEYAAIGKKLNCPENTVKTIVRRTRILMNKRVQKAATS